MAADRRRKISRRVSLRRKRQMQALFILISAMVIFVFAGSYLALRNYVRQVKETEICDNVFIGNVDVSGMTAEKAEEVMEKHLKEDRATILTMMVGEKNTETTLKELGLSVKGMDKLIQEAVDYGKKGSMWRRYRQMKKLVKKPLVIKETFVLDKESADAVFEEKVIPLENGAVDAAIRKTDNGFEIEAEKEGKTVNVIESLEKITTHLNQEWDHEDFSVEMVLKKDMPRITEADLEQIQDELGTFSTDAGGGERWQNLKTGVGKLNGVVLMPGEELSVYDTTSPYDEEHGYVEAGAYENGQIVPAFGGGICQVSSTLYNAVIYAELEVLERSPHSMTVAYVEPSRDAAIAGGYMDFRFKNPYDAPVYIYGTIDGANQLIFTIYGKETRPKNRKIEFESETVSTEEYKVVYQENPNLQLGQMQYTGNPHVGKEARLWKIIYKDGKEVSREEFNTSYYSKSDEIIEVGTKGAGAASGAISTAIASQNYEQIMNAINQAASYDQSYSEDDNEEEESDES